MPRRAGLRPRAPGWSDRPPRLEEPWRSLREAYHELRSRGSGLLVGSGLSLAEFVVLELCSRAPARASEVARAVGLSPAGATDVIDRLEQRRLVLRRAHPRDRRVVLVRLTLPGRRAYREARSSVRALLHELSGGITPQERQALAVGLAALLRTLSRRAPQDASAR